MTEVLNEEDFELFRKLIYEESGITFSATNRSILDSRLKERLREKQLTDVQEYYNLILILSRYQTVYPPFLPRNQPKFQYL